MSHPYTSRRVRQIRDTTAPPQPTGLAVAEEATGLRVTWDVSTVRDHSRWRVMKGEDDGGPYPTQVAETIGTSILDTTAPGDGTPQYYVVHDIDQANNVSIASAQDSGAMSAPVDETPPDAPANPSATLDDITILLDADDNAELDLAGYR